MNDDCRQPSEPSSKPAVRSSHAGEGVFVPSGVRHPFDPEAAIRAAFEDIDPEVMS